MHTNVTSAKTTLNISSGKWKYSTGMSAVNHTPAAQSDARSTDFQKHGAFFALINFIGRPHKKRVGDNDGLTDC